MDTDKDDGCNEDEGGARIAGNDSGKARAPVDE